MPQENYTNIPVLKDAQKELRKRKINLESSLSHPVTWSKFLLEATNKENEKDDDNRVL